MFCEKPVGLAEFWLSQAEASLINETPASAEGALAILGEVQKQRSWWDRLFNFPFNRRVISVTGRAHAIFEEAERQRNVFHAQNCLENAEIDLQRGDFPSAANALGKADKWIWLLSGDEKKRLQLVRRRLNEKLLARSA